MLTARSRIPALDGDRTNSAPSVVGELRDERGAVSAFSGWLELASALDSLAKPVGETAQTTCTADGRTSWQCNEMSNRPGREP